MENSTLKNNNNPVNLIIQYNPMYLISSVCLLIGILITSKAMQKANYELGDLILTGVCESYQFLMIGVIYLLYIKLKEYRSAFFLGALAVFLSGDITFQVENLTGIGYWGFASSAAWMSLFVIKLYLLLNIFNIKIPKIGLGLIILSTATYVVLPHLIIEPYISNDNIRKIIIFIIMFLSVVYRISNLKFSWSEHLKAIYGKHLDKIEKCIWGTLGAFFLYHTVFASKALGFGPILFICLLSVSLLFIKNEREILLLTFLIVVISLAGKIFSAGALLVAIPMFVKFYYTKNERFVYYAGFSIFLALRLFPWSFHPEYILPIIEILGALFSILGYLKYRKNEYFIPVILIILPTIYKTIELINTSMAKGILIIILSFVFLGGGLLISYIFNKRRISDDLEKKTLLEK